MKPKIAIFLYSLAGGGAERVVSILLQNLSKTHNITLVLMNPTIVYDIPKNIPVYLLESSSPDESGILKLLKLPFLAWKYSRFCIQSGITVSFSLMNRPNYINVLSKFFGNAAKIIISERGTPSRQYATQSLQGWINRVLIRWLYPKANLITTNSQGNRLDLENNFQISKPIHVLYNLFDLPAHPANTHSGSITLISIGRLDEGKNHVMLLEALTKIEQDNIHLIIAGDGPLRKHLETIIADFGLTEKVTLTGFINNPFDYLVNADIFLFASRHEGFPNVVVEAMSCGCAVISTDCRSGPREILSPNTSVETMLIDTIEYAPYGVLVPIDSAELMSMALQRLLKDPVLLHHYREQGIRRTQAFKSHTLLPNYAYLFETGSPL